MTTVQPQREIRDVKQKLLAKLGLPSNYSMEPGLKRGSKNLVSRLAASR